MKDLITTIFLVALFGSANGQKKEKYNESFIRQSNEVLTMIIDSLASYKKEIKLLKGRIDSLENPKFTPLYVGNGLSNLTLKSDCRDSVVTEWKKVSMFNLINFDKNLYNWQSGWLREERIIKLGSCYAFYASNKPKKTYYYPDKKKEFKRDVIDYRFIK